MNLSNEIMNLLYKIMNLLQFTANLLFTPIYLFQHILEICANLLTFMQTSSKFSKC